MTVVTIDQYWLDFLVSSALPVVVALVTKRFTNSTVRGLILLALSAVTGWLTSLYATGGSFELKAAVTSIFVSFVTAVASHAGLLNGSLTGDSGVILKLLPGGVGPVDQTKVDRAA